MARELTERAGEWSETRREVPNDCDGTAISRSVVETGKKDEARQELLEMEGTCLSEGRCTAGGRRRRWACRREVRTLRKSKMQIHFRV